MVEDKTKFSAIRKSYWPTAWMMSMYSGRHAVLFETCLKLLKMDSFRQTITISSIYNMVFQTMFLKPDTVGIIPRGGYRLGRRQSVLALQWLAYIGRTKNNVTHTGNGREVYLAGVPNMNFDGYCSETNEVFEYLGCF